MQVEYVQATKVDLSEAGVVKGIIVSGSVEVSDSGTRFSEFHENSWVMPFRFRIEGLPEEALLHFTSEKPVFKDYHDKDEVIHTIQFIEDGQAVTYSLPPDARGILT